MFVWLLHQLKIHGWCKWSTLLLKYSAAAAWVLTKNSPAVGSGHLPAVPCLQHQDMFCFCWRIHADAEFTLGCFLPGTRELSGAFYLWAQFATLNIEHSVVGGPPRAEHIHTSENSLISRHTETYTLFPTGTRCLCCVINQSCQIDFTAPSEKRRGSHPTTLKRWKKAGVEGLYYYRTWSLDLKNLWTRIVQLFMSEHRWQKFWVV